MKTVHVTGYQFDCLPGHVRIAGKGEGSSLRVAVLRAIGSMFNDPRLRHRQIDDFKISRHENLLRAPSIGSREFREGDMNDLRFCSQPLSADEIAGNGNRAEEQEAIRRFHEAYVREYRKRRRKEWLFWAIWIACVAYLIGYFAGMF